MKEYPFEIDDTPLDTLTVKFWRDSPGPLYTGTEPPGWMCHIGLNLVEGCGGGGPTPLMALQDLCENIAKDEGHYTDNKLLFIR